MYNMIGGGMKYLAATGGAKTDYLKNNSTDGLAGKIKENWSSQSSGDNKFPNNPDDFNPDGLTKQVYDTKNGKIIKWFDSNGKAVYEWDEDFAYGSWITGWKGN